jgi:hypothetical protein
MFPKDPRNIGTDANICNKSATLQTGTLPSYTTKALARTQGT